MMTLFYGRIIAAISVDVLSARTHALLLLLASCLSSPLGVFLAIDGALLLLATYVTD